MPPKHCLFAPPAPSAPTPLAPPTPAPPAPPAPRPRIKLNLTDIASISSASTPRPSKSLTLISTLTPCPEIELLLGPLQLIVGQIRPFKHAIKS